MNILNAAKDITKFHKKLVVFFSKNYNNTAMHRIAFSYYYFVTLIYYYFVVVVVIFHAKYESILLFRSQMSLKLTVKVKK